MEVELRNKLKQLALLDAIIEPEWEYRYYSYNSNWSDTEEMASLRDSCGGEWFFLFNENNISFKCTSPVDGLLDNFDEIKSSVPERFNSFLNEAAFSMDQGSCIWFIQDNTWIKLGKEITDLPNPMKILEMTASDYCQFVEEIFEKEIDQEVVQSIFDGNFTIDMANKINSSIDLDALQEDISEIGVSS
jgi:hypothetical protein